jgi:SAM-dependent MidA family methyltransferase
MERVLYAPGLGYYAAGARKFGAAGDFVTAPEVSPLFGRCVAQCAAEVLVRARGDVLELGPGTGRLACDVLAELDALGVLPERYCMLEVSAELRERQREAVAGLPARLASRVVWLDALPAAFKGFIAANEVLDVVPVHLLVMRGGRLCERGVGLEHDNLVWREETLLDAELAGAARTLADRHFAGHPPEGYVLEIAPQVGALVASLAAALEHGALLLIDYGFRGAEYYHPARHMGTLMCHYRHHAHADPFLFPGLQDITAHVDFTAVAETGIRCGLTFEGYTTQAQFLLASGLTERLSGADRGDPAARLKTTSAVQRLVSPAEMGELFKVIAFSRRIGPLSAFAKARPLPL